MYFLKEFAKPDDMENHIANIAKTTPPLLAPTLGIMGQKTAPGNLETKTCTPNQPQTPVRKQPWPIEQMLTLYYGKV